jgi:hypothetical protein
MKLKELLCALFFIIPTMCLPATKNLENLVPHKSSVVIKKNETYFFFNNLTDQELKVNFSTSQQQFYGQKGVVVKGLEVYTIKPHSLVAILPPLVRWWVRRPNPRMGIPDRQMTAHAHGFTLENPNNHQSIDYTIQDEQSQQSPNLVYFDVTEYYENLENYNNKQSLLKISNQASGTIAENTESNYIKLSGSYDLGSDGLSLGSHSRPVIPDIINPTQCSKNKQGQEVCQSIGVTSYNGPLHKILLAYTSQGIMVRGDFIKE